MTRKEQKRIESWIKEWEASAVRDREMAAQYRHAAAEMKAQGDDLNAVFLDSIAAQCEVSAANSERQAINLSGRLAFVER